MKKKVEKITLTEILDKIFKPQTNKADKFYCDVFFEEGATRKKVSEYLKYCHDKNAMTYNYIDELLQGMFNAFYHYEDNNLYPEFSEFDYININEDGSIYIRCEVDGFHAYIHEYKQRWFTSREYELLEPFLKQLRKRGRKAETINNN